MKIGDQYYAFNRLDPLGALFGVAANFVEMTGEMKDYDAAKLGIAAVLAFSDAIISKNYLTGLSEVLDALKERNFRWGISCRNRSAPSFLLVLLSYPVF